MYIINENLYNYSNILLFLVVITIISIFILTVSYFFVNQESNSEKLSAYECGFSPFEDARVKFDVKFYLVGILFIIFDLEVSFIFPWIITSTEVIVGSYIPMMIFLVILTVGFVYEWVKGALDWT